jgi:hypothetical protein
MTYYDDKRTKFFGGIADLLSSLGRELVSIAPIPVNATAAYLAGARN